MDPVLRHVHDNFSNFNRLDHIFNDLLTIEPTYYGLDSEEPERSIEPGGDTTMTTANEKGGTEKNDNTTVGITSGVHGSGDQSQAVSTSRPRPLRLHLDSTPTSYTITAALPGIPKSDINVSLLNNVLTIDAEKKEEKEENGRKTMFRGKWQRSVTLPEDAVVDGDGVGAKCADGVLEITVGRKPREEASAKRIKVQ